MRVERCEVKALTIFDAPALDPINVFMQDFGGGAGRIIIECYGRCWSKYWGAMGGQSLAEFFADCDAGYLAGKLHNDPRRLKKADEAYLVRIIEAVQAAIRPVAIAA